MKSLKIVLFVSFSCIVLLLKAEGKRMMGAYFANWAQYHAAPYTYTPDKLQPIIGEIDQLMYAFLYFDEQYNIKLIESKDESFIQAITSYKTSNPNLKVIASVGGWNFPSALFSQMVSSSTSRTAFINSLKSTLQKYNFDGVDIDWEYPGSVPRDDYVKITCSEIKPSHDDGGKPADTDNLLSFVKELRNALGSSMVISMASPASQDKWERVHLREMSNYLDYWHVMTYDYTVSDITNSNLTSPNSPLYTPPQATGAVQWSLDYTVTGYLSQGVPPSKIMVGIPLYGHTWFVPGLSGDQWKTFGLNASIQGDCCGPFKSTYGAKYGKGSQLCGTYMYSEIIAAGPSYYFDDKTKTAIGYLEQDSADGWTKAGTWFTYNDKSSISAVTSYINEKNLGGAFVFDISEDSINFQSGEFTYELTKSVVDGLNENDSSGNLCAPSLGTCNVCHRCCKFYLTSQRDCDACVSISCK
jgi:chitinase